MGLFTRGKVWISEDRDTYLQHDKGTGETSLTVRGTQVWKATASIFTALLGLLSSSPSAGIGYTTGAGGAVTQATSKSTGVTLNKICGAVTMNAAALAAAAEVSFTLTNSAIAATDVVTACIKSGATAGAYVVTVDAVAAGSCQISVSNQSAGSLGEAIVINFAVIKAVAA